MAKPQAGSDWLEGAGRYPLLTPAEELHLGALVREWQDHPNGPADAPPAIRRRGLKARQRMITANLRLVAHVVGKRPGCAPIDDRLQAGTIGLFRAAEKFDPTKGYKFSTFAYWWILQAIQPQNDFTRFAVHIPGNVTGYLLGWEGRISQIVIDAAEQWRLPTLGIDQPLSSNESGSATLGSAIPDKAQPTLDDYAEQEQVENALAEMANFDSEIFALMELREEGYNSLELCHVVGTSSNVVLSRLRKGTAQMRHLPAVVEVLGPAPAPVENPLRRTRRRVG
jgi:RNA polymerase sigma factor (sigma-70 family)